MNTHVLVVEDSRTQAEALQDHLTTAGYEVTVARDGAEALAMLSGEDRHDLVITDVVMPQMDGYELCRTIKADQSLHLLPVILLTSLRDPVDIVRGLEAGADNFLTKPYEPARLLSRVDSALQSHRDRADGGRFRMGAEVRLLGHRFTVDVDRQQILDLLMGSFEDLVYANARLRDQEVELVRAREDAVAANQAKSAFISRLAHELRNPLGVVSAYGDLLLDDDLSDRHRKAIEAIRTSGHRMFQLIKDLSDIEGIESGELQLSRDRVRVAPVLDDAIEQTRLLAQRHDVEVTVHGDADIEVVADDRRLCQTLTNLISNAIKYNRAGGTVQLTCLPPSGGTVRIAVADTGRGIAPEDLPRLFVPFDRLDADRDIEGSGIGLPLVQELLASMGGSLHVESEPGSGSTFTVEIPAAGPTTDVEEES
ncbi:MAG: hybrid sensor histidine kinase/response regulator [Actinobacteria bacterium]|nr:hybrid sensor histidine kinase/response regulator [Actinomycetota bacterium]